MAIIGKIREKSLLVLIVVGLGMLLFIIPFDQIANLGSAPDNSIGEINGQQIDPAAWGFDNQVEQVKFQYRQQGYNIGDDQVRGMVFNQMINDTLLNSELRAVGLRTSDDELNAITWGTWEGQEIPISEYIQNIPNFQNRETKQFSRDSLNKILRLILAQEGNGWAYEEDNIVRQNVIKKYLSMVTKGIIVTDNEAKREYYNQQQKVSFRYAYQPYSAIPDSIVKVTDADIEAYYNAHKADKRYDMEESRSFKFVTIPIEPSAKDKETQFSNEMAETLKAEWLKAENDSQFVVTNSVNPYYSPQFVQPNSMPVELEEQIQTLDSGQVFGPYEDAIAKTTRIGKVIEIQTEPQARVRHILCGFAGDNSPENKNKQRALADSIQRILQADTSKFSELVLLSTDVASVPNGGVYEWFNKGRMVPEFEEWSFNKQNLDQNKIGVVETTYGYHVIENLGLRDFKQVKAAFIDKLINPSKKTIDNLELDLAAELDQARAAGSLDLIALKHQAEVKEENDALVSTGVFQNPELENSNTLLRWAYNALPGDISSIQFLPKSNVFVVAQLTQNIPSGPMSLATAKTALKGVVANKKKVELAQETVGGKSLNEVAGIWGTKPEEIQAISFAANGVGAQSDENGVIGAIFNLAPGATSQVIEGNSGMYVVEVKEFTTAPDPVDLTNNKTTAEEAIRSRADQDVMIALRGIAGVKDNRMKRRLSSEQ